MNSSLDNSDLGRKTVYKNTYDARLLFPIARQVKRSELGVADALPFHGFDAWHAYELSWLNRQGKPMVATGEFIFPCASTHLIESKSFKLYLNSFNQTAFDDMAQVQARMQQDLTAAAGAQVKVLMKLLSDSDQDNVQHLVGTCLDDQAITCDTYHVQPDYLQTQDEQVAQTLYSHLLKSNCPVTDQPDWASIAIDYSGAKIDPAGLLRYIVSFREHQDFHEQCIERIFLDIMQRCQPERLTVRAYYTRRGGLDICPLRSTQTNLDELRMRLWRQ